MSPVDAAHCPKQTALALRDAAENGIVHGDIKSDNLLFGGRNVLKVPDFGISKVVREDRYADQDAPIADLDAISAGRARSTRLVRSLVRWAAVLVVLWGWAFAVPGR